MKLLAFHLIPNLDISPKRLTTSVLHFTGTKKKGQLDAKWFIPQNHTHIYKDLKQIQCASKFCLILVG